MFRSYPIRNERAIVEAPGKSRRGNISAKGNLSVTGSVISSARLVPARFHIRFRQLKAYYDFTEASPKILTLHSNGLLVVFHFLAEALNNAETVIGTIRFARQKYDAREKKRSSFR